MLIFAILFASEFVKIAIIGSGAVGLFYGAELQRSGQEVHFLFRGDYETARVKGVTVRKENSEYCLSPVNAHRSTDAIGVCDLVIVALKTTSNAALPELLQPLVGRTTILLTMQNGLGSDKLLIEMYPTNPVLGCLCFICLNRTAPALVENYIRGSVTIGPQRPEFTAEGKEVAALFEAAEIDTRYENSLQVAQWKKLIWNIPFNGLTIALGALPTSVVVGSPSMEIEARALMSEVIAGAEALGLTIDQSYIDFQIARTGPMDDYRPSSMIDFVEGRQVEVEAIWGEPLRQATSAGADLPKLGMLYSLLKLLCE